MSMNDTAGGEADTSPIPSPARYVVYEIYIYILAKNKIKSAVVEIVAQ